MGRPDISEATTAPSSSPERFKTGWAKSWGPARTLNESEQIHLFAGLLKRQQLYTIGIVGDREVKRAEGRDGEGVGAEVISEQNQCLVVSFVSMTRPVNRKMLGKFAGKAVSKQVGLGDGNTICYCGPGNADVTAGGYARVGARR